MSRPPRVFVVSDQSATYHPYLAFVGHILRRELGLDTPVQHVYLRMRTPMDKSVDRLRLGLRREGATERDPVIAFRDSEALTSDHLRAARQALAEVVGRLETHRHSYATVLNPMTEAVLLLHDDWLGLLVEEKGKDIKRLEREKRAGRVVNKDLLIRSLGLRFRGQKKKKVVCMRLAAMIEDHGLPEGLEDIPSFERVHVDLREMLRQALCPA